eukprot:ANDGO_04964.mRNA.1 hypothetical protein
MRGLLFLSTLCIALSLCSQSLAGSCLGTQNSKCAIGDRIQMQFTFSNASSSAFNGTTSSYFATYYPKVDQFNRVSVTGWDNTTYAQQVTFSLRIGDLYSPVRVYKSLDGTVGFFVLAVNMDNGVVTSASWDDTCSGSTCVLDSSIKCIGNSNGKNCAPNDCGSCFCNVFLAYKGQDSNGEYLTSYDFVPTNYRSFSFGGVYNDMFSKYD